MRNVNHLNLKYLLILGIGAICATAMAAVVVNDLGSWESVDAYSYPAGGQPIPMSTQFEIGEQFYNLKYQIGVNGTKYEESFELTQSFDFGDSNFRRFSSLEDSENPAGFTIMDVYCWGQLNCLTIRNHKNGNLRQSYRNISATNNGYFSGSLRGANLQFAEQAAGGWTAVGETPVPPNPDETVIKLSPGEYLSEESYFHQMNQAPEDLIIQQTISETTWTTKVTTPQNGNSYQYDLKKVQETTLIDGGTFALYTHPSDTNISTTPITMAQHCLPNGICTQVAAFRNLRTDHYVLTPTENGYTTHGFVTLSNGTPYARIYGNFNKND